MLHETRWAIRSVRRRSGIPLLVAGVVALGVTFFTTAFAVFDAMLWRPLPFGSQSEYVLLGETRLGAIPPMARASTEVYAAAREAFERGRLRSIRALIPLKEENVTLTVDGVGESEVATRLTGEGMSALGVLPVLGRYPADPDGAARLAREIAINESLWRRRFGGSAAVLGRSVLLDGEPAVVVGVMPRAFQFHRISQIWVAWAHEEVLSEGGHGLTLVARLHPGADAEDAGRDYSPLFYASLQSRPAADSGLRSHIQDGPFGQSLVPEQLAFLLVGAMMLVLLAACVNVGMLFLARVRSRAPELATHAALGGGTSTIVRQLLLEIGLILLLGATVAVYATAALLHAIGAAMQGVLPLWAELRLDARGFLVALTALAVGALVLALPAARAGTRLDLARHLGHAGVLGRAPRHRRGVSVLIALQVGIVVVLAAATTPLAVSARKLAGVTTTIDDDRIAHVRVQLGGGSFADAEARDAYAERARARLAVVPGVEGVARVGIFGAWRAGSTPWSDTLYTDRNEERVPWHASWRATHRVVSADYFSVVGLPIVAGSALPEGIGAGHERVAVISAEFARQVWPGESPIGRCFRWGATTPCVRVVGVAGDDVGIYQDWDGTTVRPHMHYYLSEHQAIPQEMRFFVRAHEPGSDALRWYREAIAGLDAAASVSSVRWLATEFDEPRLTRKWLAIVLGSGAVVTVALAMIGVFGLVSYYTSVRLRELALRVALGAPRRTIVWLVTRDTLRSVAWGTAGGLLFLSLVQRLVERFAYETSAFELPGFLGIAALMLAVIITAMSVPLRRVRELAPQELLRQQ